MAITRKERVGALKNMAFQLAQIALSLSAWRAAPAIFARRLLQRPEQPNDLCDRTCGAPWEPRPKAGVHEVLRLHRSLSIATSTQIKHQRVP